MERTGKCVFDVSTLLKRVQYREEHPYSDGDELGGASLCLKATGVEESGICFVNPINASAPVPEADQNPRIGAEAGNRVQIEEYFHSLQEIVC